MRKLEFTGRYDEVQRNFDAIEGSLPDAGRSVSLRFGSSTVTITDGTSAVSGNVAHGLGKAPLGAVATAQMTADTRDDYIVTVASKDATNLTFRVRGGAAESFALPNPTVVTFYWWCWG